MRPTEDRCLGLSVICTIGSYVCICCFFLDFKRLLAYTLNLVIGHLVPPPKCRNWGDVPNNFLTRRLRPPKPDLVENCEIFTPHHCLAAPQGVIPSEFREDLDIHKTRMNGLSCGVESMTVYSAVLIQYQRVTDGRPAYIYYVLQHS